MRVVTRQFMFVAAAWACLLCSVGIGVADPRPERWVERCGGVYALCGYIDRATLESRIDRKFEVALPFSEGLAAVRSEGKFGYINSSGDMVIAPMFDLARAFRKGHAEVVAGDKAGIIDRTGKLVLPPNYARAIPFAADGTRSSRQSDRAGIFWLPAFHDRGTALREGRSTLSARRSALGKDPEGRAGH
ncbi:WG repeat-containing protein [Rhizobium leguminosarum]|uniref:WG repeat-containing protein n=1 Tax=Rhizobium leguminosarum TaxID=384 RepID=UPI001FF03885|nr:WG repeat-containing protein [Rhizobium leguminosarum]